MTLSDIKVVTAAVLSTGAIVSAAALVAWTRHTRPGSNVSGTELFLIGCWMILPFMVLFTAYFLWPEPRPGHTLSIVSGLVAAISLVGYSHAAVWNGHHRSLLEGIEVLVLPLYQLGAIALGAIVMCVQWLSGEQSRSRRITTR